MILNVPPSPVLHSNTPSVGVVVQNVPLGTLTPGSAGVPGLTRGVRRIEERILAVMELGGWCGFDED
jgi:hypothetical protein